MTRRWWIVLVAVGAIGAAAAADEAFLYARSKNTHMNRTPEAGGEMLALLQPGAKVTDLGKAPVKNWRKVRSLGVEGFIFLSNLSTTSPHEEVVGGRGNASLSPEAFASSGAATKALGAGAIDYGNGKNYQRAVREIQLAEDLSKAIDENALRDHEVAAKIHLVTAPTPGGKP